MRNWACARKQGIFPFSFLICHFSFLNLSHFSFSILTFSSFSFLICHLSFVIFKSFSFLICHLSFLNLSHFFIREREGNPCIDAQQDDEQGLDGVDNQYEEQGIV